MAHTRYSRPVAGLGFQTKNLELCEMFPLKHCKMFPLRSESALPRSRCVVECTPSSARSQPVRTKNALERDRQIERRTETEKERGRDSGSDSDRQKGRERKKDRGRESEREREREREREEERQRERARERGLTPIAPQPVHTTHAAVAPPSHASERRGNTLNCFKDLCLKAGQNLALTVLYVPCSLDSSSGKSTVSLEWGLLSSELGTYKTVTARFYRCREPFF